MSTERALAWVATTHRVAGPGGVVTPHAAGGPTIGPGWPAFDRAAREELADRLLAPGATRAHGAGARARPEEPDPERTCFERDRDRILHCSAFRRLAGKTQVFVFPADHQRTRLTHALEVAQVATSVARAVGLNVALTEAIALGHDCGHGPGGHASEDAFAAFLPEGYDHAPWGADVTLAPLNLCAETLDGIRNHSWSRPPPATPEAAVVSWADRCAYTAHDLEDAVRAGIVTADDVPAEVAAVAGRTRRDQLRVWIAALVDCIRETGVVGMRPEPAAALAALRAFDYERIYTRPASVRQAEQVVSVLRALVEHFAEQFAGHPPSGAPGPGADGPGQAGPGAPPEDPVRAAVAYVGGMTDRFAFDTAVAVLGWDRDRLPRGVS
ncbi:MAG TPA: HD domain-containing protein [Frankiaceae bacterium]|nr:HD domain-containing protein [Frankiaceae bacterium]